MYKYMIILIMIVSSSEASTCEELSVRLHDTPIVMSIHYRTAQIEGNGDIGKSQYCLDNQTKLYPQIQRFKKQCKNKNDQKILKQAIAEHDSIVEYCEY